MIRTLSYLVIGLTLFGRGAFADPSTVASESSSPPITVSVLGSVNQPGVVYIAANGSLIGAIAEAGGWTKTANLKKVTVLHGKAGEKPEKTEYDVMLILGAQKTNPKLSDGDVVYIPDRVF